MESPMHMVGMRSARPTPDKIARQRKQQLDAFRRFKDKLKAEPSEQAGNMHDYATARGF